MNTSLILNPLMISEFLVLSMTQSLELAGLDLDQLDQKMVLVVHDDNLQIYFKDPFIGKNFIFVLFFFSLFLLTPLLRSSAVVI